MSPRAAVCLADLDEIWHMEISLRITAAGKTFDDCYKSKPIEVDVVVATRNPK